MAYFENKPQYNYANIDGEISVIAYINNTAQQMKYTW